LRCNPAIADGENAARFSLPYLEDLLHPWRVDRDSIVSQDDPVLIVDLVPDDGLESPFVVDLRNNFLLVRASGQPVIDVGRVVAEGAVVIEVVKVGLRNVVLAAFGSFPQEAVDLDAGVGEVKHQDVLHPCHLHGIELSLNIANNFLFRGRLRVSELLRDRPPELDASFLDILQILQVRQHHLGGPAC
jgi:hypothetical protein